MSQVEAETSIQSLGDGRYSARLEAAWNIGSNPNGGYAMLPALRAMLDLAEHPDPLSTTVHFVRPAIGDCDAEVTARIARAGRSTTYCHRDPCPAGDAKAHRPRRARRSRPSGARRSSRPQRHTSPARSATSGPVRRSEPTRPGRRPCHPLPARGAHPPGSGHAGPIPTCRRGGLDPALGRCST